MKKKLVKVFGQRLREIREGLGMTRNRGRDQKKRIRARNRQKLINNYNFS